MSHAVKIRFSRINTSFVAGAFVLSSPQASARASTGNEHAPVGQATAQRPDGDRRFGLASQWVVGVDGLLTVSYMSQHEVSSFVDASGNRQGTKLESLSTVLFVPRLDVDAFVIDHVSIGLGATYSQNDAWFTTTAPDGTVTSQNSMSAVTVSPRVGLAYGSACGLGVWGRAGITFGATWQSTDAVQLSQSFGSYGLAASADLVATYSPRKDLVLTAGPWLKEGIESWSDSSSVQPTIAPPDVGMSIGAGLVL
jgi:hypothetical protein